MSLRIGFLAHERVYLRSVEAVNIQQPTVIYLSRKHHTFVMLIRAHGWVNGRANNKICIRVSVFGFVHLWVYHTLTSVWQRTLGTLKCLPVTCAKLIVYHLTITEAHYVAHTRFILIIDINSNVIHAEFNSSSGRLEKCSEWDLEIFHPSEWRNTNERTR